MFVSCTNRVVNKNDTDPVGIDLESIVMNDRLDVTTVAISENNQSVVQGPIIDGVQENLIQSEPRQKSVAIILGPGLNRVISYASMLNSLEKNKIPIHYVVGVGYGAIVAAMYASGMSGSKIEWYFHNFLNKIRNKRPFSSSWNNAVVEYLVSKIEISRIEQAQKVLIIPSVDQQTKMIAYGKRGDLKMALEFNYNFPEYFENGFDIDKFNFYDPGFFKKSGVDLSIAINILEDLVFLESEEEYLSGYLKMKNGFYKIKSRVDIFYNLPTKQVFMDHPENVPELLLRTGEESDKLSKIIIEKLNM